MIVTESKLTELLGYTKSEIKGRRQAHWIEGVHYAYDPARKAVYNVGEIERWAFQASEMYADAARLGGTRTVSSEQNCFNTPSPQQGNRKRQRFV